MRRRPGEPDHRSCRACSCSSRAGRRCACGRSAPSSCGPLEVPDADALADGCRGARAPSPSSSSGRWRSARLPTDARRRPRDIAGIVRALDGVPLAIELAAARTRTMSPREILERLDSALSLLVGGARDLPERQRTVRSTIEWSVRPARRRRARAAFEALSVFSGPFTLRGGRGGARAATAASRSTRSRRSRRSIDTSLLWQRDRDGERVFGMLVLVRAFARGAGRTTRRRHPPSRRTRALGRVLRRAWRREAPTRHARRRISWRWMRRLDAEAENLASVMRHLLDAARLDEAAEYAWSLYLYLWIGGLLGVVRDWMAELLERARARRRAARAPHRGDRAVLHARGRVTGRIRTSTSARVCSAAPTCSTQSATRSAPPWRGCRSALGLPRRRRRDPISRRRAAILERSLAGFTAAGDAWGEAMALVTLGRIDLAAKDIGRCRERASTRASPLASSAGETARHRHRPAPPRLAEALRRRPRRGRGGLRRVARHLAGDAPRRGHRLRAARGSIGRARCAGRRRAAPGCCSGAAQRLRRRTGHRQPGRLRLVTVRSIDSAARAGGDARAAGCRHRRGRGPARSRR